MLGENKELRRKTCIANLFTASTHISWEYTLFDSILGQWKTWLQNPLMTSYENPTKLRSFVLFIILNTIFLAFDWKQIQQNIQMTKK